MKKNIFQLHRFVWLLLISIVEIDTPLYSQNKNNSVFDRPSALWLRADKGAYTLFPTTNKYNGTLFPADHWSPVGNWRDFKIGNQAKPITGNGPRFCDNGEWTINFNPVIFFNNEEYYNVNMGYDRFVEADENSKGMTWFVVLNPSDGITKEYPIVYDFGGFPNYSYSLLYNDSLAGVNALDEHVITDTHNRKLQVTLLRQSINFEKKKHYLYANGDDLLVEQDLNVNELTVSKTEIPNKIYAKSHFAKTSSYGSFTIGTQAKKDEYLENGLTRSFGGSIAEIVGFVGILSDSEVLEMETYLSLKYGLTRNSSHPEYKLMGKTLWDPSLGYNHAIAGLANYSDLLFNQRISRSVNSDAVITLSTNNNFILNNLNYRPSLPNNSAILWGNNGLKGTSFNSKNGFPLGYLGLPRKWKVQATGTQIPVNLSVDFNNKYYNIEHPEDDVFLVVTKDNDKSFEDAKVYGMNEYNHIFETENVELGDEVTFSFATPMLTYEFEYEKPLVILENDTTIIVEILLYSPQPLKVDHKLSLKLLGTAIEGIDYEIITSKTTIPAGDYSNIERIPIKISIKQDYKVEGNETIRIIANISPERNYAGDINRDGDIRDTCVVVIKDDDVNSLGGIDIKIERNTDRVIEGDSLWFFASIGKIIAPKDIEIAVKHSNKSSTAKIDDYRIVDLIVIPEGSSQSDTIWFNALVDNKAEGEEVLDVILKVDAINTINPSNLIFHIKDKSEDLRLKLHTPQNVVKEGNKSYIYAELLDGIEAGRNLVLDLMVDLNSTAKPNIDYGIKDNKRTLRFSENKSVSDTLSFEVFNDNIYDPWETILTKAVKFTDARFKISPLDPIVIQHIDTTNGARNEITEITFDVKKNKIYEGETTDIYLKLPGTMKMSLTLNLPFKLYHPYEGSTLNSTDYYLSDKLIISQGQNKASGFIRAKINDKQSDMNLLNIYVEPEKLDPYLNIVPSSKTIELLDVEGVALIIENSEIKEGEVTAIYANITEGFGFGGEVTIHLQYLPDSKADLDDYSQNSYTLTIPKNSISSDTIYIEALHDNKYETSEHLYLRGEISIEDGFQTPKLLEELLRIDIYNVDSSEDTFSDTTNISMHFSSNSLPEGDCLEMWVELPDGMIAQDTTKVYLEYSEVKIYSLDRKLVILPNSNRSNNIELCAPEDNIFDLEEEVIVYTSIEDEFARITPNETSIKIVNVDTTSGGLGLDGIRLNYYLDKDTIIGDDVAELTLKLPGTTIASHDIIINIELDESSLLSEDDGFIIDSEVVIEEGKNEAKANIYSYEDLRLEVLKEIIFHLSTENPKITIEPNKDTLLIIDRRVYEKSKMFELVVSNHLVSEGDSVMVFVKLLEGYVAGQDIPIDIMHPNDGAATSDDYYLGNHVVIKENSSVSDTIYLVAFSDGIIEQTEEIIINAKSTLFTNEMFKGGASVSVIDETKTDGILLSISKDSVREGEGVYLIAKYDEGIVNTSEVFIDWNEDIKLTIPAGKSGDSIYLFIERDFQYEGFRKVVFEVESAEKLHEDSKDPISLIIIDAEANEKGGADLVYTNVPNDKIVRGEESQVSLKFRDEITAKYPLKINLTHPLDESENTGQLNVDYSLAGSITIEAGESGAILPFISISNNIVGNIKTIGVRAEGKRIHNILNSRTKIDILDEFPSIINIEINIDSSAVYEGDTLLVEFVLPDGLVSEDSINIKLDIYNKTKLIVESQSVIIAPGVSTVNAYLPIDEDYVYTGNQLISVSAKSNHPRFVVKPDTLDVSVFDAEANKQGGVDLVLEILDDSLFEGDKTHLVLRFENDIVSSVPIQVNVNHPIFVGEDKGVFEYDYRLGNEFIIEPGEVSDSLIFIHLDNSTLDFSKTVNLQVTSIYEHNNILPSNGLVHLLNRKIVEKSKLFEIIVSKDKVKEGDILELYIKLIDDNIAGVDIPVQLVCHGEYGALYGKDYTLPLDFIIPKGSNVSEIVEFKALSNSVHEGDRDIEIVATSELFPLNKASNIFVTIVDQTRVQMTYVLDKDTLISNDVVELNVFYPKGEVSYKDQVFKLDIVGGTIDRSRVEVSNDEVRLSAGEHSASILIGVLEDFSIYPLQSLIYKIYSTDTLFSFTPSLDTLYVKDSREGKDEVFNVELSKLEVKEGDNVAVNVFMSHGYIAGEDIPISISKIKENKLNSPEVSVIVGKGSSVSDTVLVEVPKNNISEGDRTIVANASSLLFPSNMFSKYVEFKIIDQTRLSIDYSISKDTIIEGNKVDLTLLYPNGGVEKDAEFKFNIIGGTIDPSLLELSNNEIKLLAGEHSTSISLGVIENKQLYSMQSLIFSVSTLDTLFDISPFSDTLYVKDKLEEDEELCFKIGLSNTEVEEGGRIAIYVSLIDDRLAGEDIPIILSHKIEGEAVLGKNYSLPNSLTILKGSNVSDTVYLETFINEENGDGFGVEIEISSDLFPSSMFDKGIMISVFNKEYKKIPEWKVRLEVEGIESITEDYCDHDIPYLDRDFWALDTQKSHAIIYVEINDIYVDLIDIECRADASIKGLYTVDYDQSNNEFFTPPDFTRAIINVNRDKLNNADADGKLTVIMSLLGEKDSVTIWFNNDFDSDGIPNAEERESCFKYVDGIPNEWFYNEGEFGPVSSDIHVRKSLSPNGDGFGNEILRIDNIENYQDNEVVVFNRTGKVVYKENGYNNSSKSFDGTDMITGQRLPIGAYFFFVRYNDGFLYKDLKGYFEIRH